MKHCIMKHCIMEHCIIQHCIMKHCIMKHCIMEQCIMKHATRGTTVRVLTTWSRRIYNNYRALLIQIWEINNQTLRD